MYKTFHTMIMAIAMAFAMTVAPAFAATSGLLNSNLVQVAASQCEVEKSITAMSDALAQEGIGHVVVTGDALDAVATALTPTIGPKPSAIHGMIFIKPDVDNPQNPVGVAFFNENMCLLSITQWPAKVVEIALIAFRGV